MAKVGLYDLKSSDASLVTALVVLNVQASLTVCGTCQWSMQRHRHFLILHEQSADLVKFSSWFCFSMLVVAGSLNRDNSGPANDEPPALHTEERISPATPRNPTEKATNNASRRKLRQTVQAQRYRVKPQYSHLQGPAELTKVSSIACFQQYQLHGHESGMARVGPALVIALESCAGQT